jgi:hypothetical protein
MNEAIENAAARMITAQAPKYFYLNCDFYAGASCSDHIPCVGLAFEAWTAVTSITL